MNTACWVLRHNVKWREAHYDQLWTPQSLIRRSLMRSGNLLFAEASLGGCCSPRLGHSCSYRTHFKYFTRTIKTSSQRTIHLQNCFIWLSTWTHRKNYRPSVLVTLLGCVSRVCNFLGSVSSQQKFEATDIKALSVSQLLDRSVLQLSFIPKIKENTSLTCEGTPTQKTQREERERKMPSASLFICFFSSPLGLPYVNWASQESCLFYLRSSLQSLDLPLFYFRRLFPFLVF